jgi:SRSO17 transposase
LTRKTTPRFLKDNSKYDKKTTFAQGLEGRLTAFVECFKSVFTLYNSSSDQICDQYFNGLFLSEKRNCQSISEKVSCHEQSLNHFISDSPWDYNQLFSLIASKFTSILPLSWKNDLCLAIDESSFPKKGNKSVGVSHQYCGQLGKLANCQVGVFASLICRNLYCLILAVLFLPQKWIDIDIKETDIPAVDKVYKTKIEIALEIIIRVKTVFKIPFKWVCFDSFYGRDSSLLFSLQDLSITFMADIPNDHAVYLKLPKVLQPVNSIGKRGRKSTRKIIKGRSIVVNKIAGQIKETDYREIILRKNNNGKNVKAKFFSCPANIIKKADGSVMNVILLIRKDDDGTIRYTITNAINESLERLAFMQAQRYFIERSFQEAKQQLGMNEYQIRGYKGWHRHMAMTSLALLFVQIEKQLYRNEGMHPTTPILCKIIIKLLPQKILSLQDLLKKVSKPLNKNRKKLIT